MSILRETAKLFREIAPVMIAFVFLVALSVAVWWAVDHYFGLPVVYESYSSGECVKVEAEPADCYDCANLPDKYLHVWVM